MASSAVDQFASVRETIYQAISGIRLIDPHTHINPLDPGSHTLADILGYHYYTELVHSAGLPRQEIEEPGITPRELVGRLVHGLGNITNTANHHWLIDICRTFFDFTDDAITPDNWEGLFDTAEAKMASPAWPQMVLDQSNVESVFLTNDFDDPLEGFDANTYIPCLRTDDLVFHLSKPDVQDRLQRCSGITLDGATASLRAALRQRFEHFVSHGARACAISIPPSFEPVPITEGRAQVALDQVLQQGTSADESHRMALSRYVFWILAELCDDFGLPFDLMIGVNRGVYPGGVFQGQDLYDSRVSLIQYRELFNSFPKVKFPVSVLASVTNQELVSYSWIFPNVLTNGHWWYSNTPSFIHRDAAARLEAVPRNKQIAYYSDAYKLEFVLPKFGMYRRILSRILAEEFVGENGWSEEKAIELGRQVLRGNVDEVFPSPLADTESESSTPALQVASDQDSEAPATVGMARVIAMEADPPETANAQDPVTPQSEAETIDDLLGSDFAAEDFIISVSPEKKGASSSETEDDIVVGEDEGDSDSTTPLTDLLDSAGENFDSGDTLAEEAPGDDVSKTVRAGSGTALGMDRISPEADQLDPVPTEAEVQDVEVRDVEITEMLDRAELTSLDAEIEAPPLDVGNLVGEQSPDQPAPFTKNSSIQPLSGDGEFVPDGNSMVLEPDPMTGELHFPVDEAESTIDESPSESAADAPDTDDEDGFGAGIF